MKGDLMKIITLLSALAGCSFEGHGIIPSDAGDDPDVGTTDDADDAVVADAPPRFSSCVGLAATCGPNSNDNCCSTATPIPGGSFLRSYDVATDGMYQDMTHPATVSPFMLDKYEVTVGRFRAFLAAGNGTRQHVPAAGTGSHPQLANSGWSSAWDASLSPDLPALTAGLKCDVSWQTWTDTAGVNESLPINCVSWYEAMAFCVWDGGHLATETEWNFAASGGNDHRAFPWSSPASSLTSGCTYANSYNGTSYCGDAPDPAIDRAGSYPQGNGRWGHSDLAGNVWEWTLDWYATPYPQGTCSDCANLVQATKRVIRGGTFDRDVSTLRSASRDSATPETRLASVGIRCARL
jgi:sulfatase modifying factor 1